MHARLIYVFAPIVLAAAFLISGCTGSPGEVDAIAFGLAMGIDAAEDKQIEVSYQLGRIAPTGGGGSDQSQAPGATSEVVTIKAPNLAEARNLLGSSVATRTNLSQVKVFVIGEKLARRGVKDVLAPIVRFREFRGTMFVIVVKGSARDFLLAYKPIFVASPAKFYELFLASYEETSYFPHTQLHNFYLQMKSYSGEPYAVYAALNPLTGEGAGGTKLAGTKFKEITAGQIARRGGNPTELLGTAIFKGDKMVGVLTNHETQALAILTGRFRSGGYLTVEDPLEPEAGVNVKMALTERPRIKAWLENGRPVFAISVKLEGEITSIPSGINYEQAEYRTLLEQKVANVYQAQLEKYIRVTQQLNCDPAGLGYYLRTNFTTRNEFNNYGWNDKYRDAVITVTVEARLFRTGLMFKTNPIVAPGKEQK
jgi:spore germination protein KC